MHTYIGMDDGTFVVGFEYARSGDANFRAIKQFDSEVKAASYVSYLNGGGWLEEDDDDNNDHNGDDL